jgi:DNA-binding transcriptional ArsR family regulator
MQSIQVVSMSRALKALSDSNRIRILEILVKGEFCVSDLVERLQIDQPKVSHHLAILRSAGVIRSRRDGRRINYSLRPTVHQRVEAADGPSDVFDLGTLSVAFRFRAEGDSASGSPGAAAAPGREPPRQGPASAEGVAEA